MRYHYLIIIIYYKNSLLLRLYFKYVYKYPINNYTHKVFIFNNWKIFLQVMSQKFSERKCAKFLNLFALRERMLSLNQVSFVQKKKDTDISRLV